MPIWSLLPQRDRQLIACFGLYILLMLSFGLIYLLEFRRYPQDAFSFNSDLRDTQVRLAEPVLRAGAVKLNQKLDAFRQFAAFVNRPGVEMESGGTELRITTAQYSFRFYIAGIGAIDPIVDPTAALVLEVRDTLGYLVASDEWLPAVEVPRDLLFYTDYAARTIGDLERGIASHGRRLANLRSAAPEVWSYWDFLYFSVVTQTTVGYGDILPNRTQVRMLVVLQILLGLALLSIAVNLSLSRIVRPAPRM